MGGMLLFIGVTCFIMLFYSFKISRDIIKNSSGTDKMQFIASKISEGSLQFLNRIYTYIGVFILCSSFLLLSLSFFNNDLIHRLSPLSFAFGAILSLLSGWVGMKIATVSNVRTAHAATNNLKSAFNIAFSGGNVMGIAVCCFGVLGLSIILTFYFVICRINNIDFFNINVLKLVFGDCICFAFGAEITALFCRIAGGIFTKAADIGADLVGKIEKNIPEDDHRNPAVIADNVGDNVGDIAGMGADLFGSFVSTIVAAMFLGIDILAYKYQTIDYKLVFYPFIFCFIGGIISLIINKILIYLKTADIENILNKAIVSNIIVNTVVAFILSKILLGSYYIYDGILINNNSLFLSIAIGLVMSYFINVLTKYYTSSKYSPVKFVIKQSSGGHASNVIAGLSVGMQSLLPCIFILVVGMFLSYSLNGFYGIALSAVGLMSTIITQLSIDTFGAISDNAGGIAEMGGLDEQVRKNTDVLDALGNTTAATGKIFTMISASLTFFVLLSILMKFVNINVEIFNVYVVFGLLLGVLLPVIISSILIKSVGNAAIVVVEEVRRQFNNIKGLITGDAEPDYNSCIDISAKAAVNGMLLPGFFILLSPILLFLICGKYLFIGFLFGVFLGSVFLGFFQSNVGGIWDNAKKAFENGVEINGETFYKGSEVYKASVTGDTIGDPLKDTSGPAMNIVMKIIIFVSLFIMSFYNCDICKNKNKEKYFDDDKSNNTFYDMRENVGKISYKEPKVYFKKDKKGNYEKLSKYDNGYIYERYYSI